MKKLKIYFFVFLVLLVSTLADDSCNYVDKYANLSVSPCYATSTNGEYEYKYTICNNYYKDLDISTNSIFNQNLLKSEMYKLNNVCTNNVINATLTIKTCSNNNEFLALDQTKQKVTTYAGATIPTGTCQDYLYKFKPNANNGKFDVQVLGYDKGFLAVNFTLDPFYNLTNYFYWRDPLGNNDYIRFNISANQTYILQYSNSSDVVAQDGKNTFDVFDDFNSGSLDTTLWTSSSGMSITDGFAQNDGTGSRYITYNRTGFNQNVTNEYNFVFKTQGGGVDQPIRQTQIGVSTSSSCIAGNYPGGVRVYQGRASSNSWFVQDGTNTLTATATGKGTLNTNYTASEFWYPNFFNASIDNAVFNAGTTLSPTSIYYSLCVASAGVLAFDNYRVYRRFISQPTITYGDNNITINNANGGNFGLYTLKLNRLNLAGNLGFKLYTNVSASVLSVTFDKQVPTDLDLLKVAIGNLNITYNISSTNPLTISPTLFYNVTLNNVFVNSYSNDKIILMNSSAKNTSNSNNTYLFQFTLGENDIFPLNEFLNYSYFGQLHSTLNLNTKTNYLKLKFKNLLNDTPINIFEIMANATTLTDLQPVYYCNSTYTTGAVTTDINCVNMGTFSNGYQHTHSNFVSHNLITFNVVNKSINGKAITDPSYFVFTGANNYNFYYINNRTNDTTKIQTSNNGGNSYSDFVGTIDSHIHQYSTNINFSQYVCANSSTNGECSTSRSQNFGVSLLPPTSFSVISPINQSYGDKLILINYTSSSAINGQLTHYNISVIDSNNVLDLFINNGLNLTYSFNATTLQNGLYFVKVQVYDNNSLSSVAVSDQFTINNSYVEPTTINGIEKAIDRASNKFEIVFFIILAILCYFFALMSNTGNKNGSTFLMICSVVCFLIAVYLTPEQFFKIVFLCLGFLVALFAIINIFEGN